VPACNGLAAASFDGSRTYADVVRFVHVYVIEPHPLSPDPSPYRGEVWEHSYSTVRQPYTYDARVENARGVEPSITGDQVLVVDDLTPHGPNNPAWCTYGTCPNCAFLIRQDGIIDTVQTWIDTASMQMAIDALVE
jgi:hypothetical protein